jgi:hypothetical protein
MFLLKGFEKWQKIKNRNKKAREKNEKRGKKLKAREKIKSAGKN